MIIIDRITCEQIFLSGHRPAVSLPGPGSNKFCPLNKCFLTWRLFKVLDLEDLINILTWALAKVIGKMSRNTETSERRTILIDKECTMLTQM